MATATYDLLDSTVLTGNTTSLSFTSIDQSYRDLRLVCWPRWRNSGWRLLISVNNNTTDLYPYQTLSGFNSTIYSNDQSGSVKPFKVPFQNNGFGDGQESDLYELDFFDYTATDRYKHILFRTGNTDSTYKNTQITLGAVRNTSAITSMEFAVEGDLLLAGGRFELYGIAG